MPLKVLIYLLVLLLLSKLLDLPVKWRWRTKNRPQKEIFSCLTQLIYEHQFPGQYSKTAPGLPVYKYFTGLIENLLRISRQYGGPLFTPLTEIRKGLALDLQFEEKYRKESQAGLAQMLFLVAIVWFFILSARSLAELDFSWSMYLVIGLLHLSGMACFWRGQQLIKQRLFSGTETYFCGLYSCKALLATAVPLNVAMVEAKLGAIFADHRPRFAPLRQGLKAALERLQSKGAPIQGELELLLQELWHLQEASFIEFGRQFLALRLSVLSLFFLGSYLYFMATPVGQLLSQLN